MRKSFCLTLCGAASLFLMCFSAWASESVGSELSEARQVAQYNYVIHILAMLLVGMGRALPSRPGIWQSRLLSTPG